MKSGIVVPLAILGAYFWALVVFSVFLPAVMLLVSTLAQVPHVSALLSRGGVKHAVSPARAREQRAGHMAWPDVVWAAFLGVAVLLLSYTLGWVILAAPGSPLTVTLPGVKPSTWAKVPLLAPVLTLVLVRDVMRQAVGEQLKAEPLTERRAVAGRRWLPTRKSTKHSVLRWPPELVHELDARARVAQTAVWKIYAKTPGAALGCALITFGYAENDPRWSHDIAPGTSGFVAAMIVMAILAQLSLVLVSWELLIPSKIRMQVDILRCLADKPVEAWSLGMVDPIGSHRAPLNRIAKRLRSHARRLEVRLPNPPIALVLRGAAQTIDTFTSGAKSLESELPEEVHQVLRHTAAVMAGQSEPETLRSLAQMVAAFDSAGSPNPELVESATGRLARAGAAIYLAADRLSGFTKALFVLVMLGVFVALLIQGRADLTTLPGWKP